jgi:hypothetical protein
LSGPDDLTVTQIHSAFQQSEPGQRGQADWMCRESTPTLPAALGLLCAAEVSNALLDGSVDVRLF